MIQENKSKIVIDHINVTDEIRLVRVFARSSKDSQSVH